jgi:hypothetical protein
MINQLIAAEIRWSFECVESSPDLGWLDDLRGVGR